jgi:hypothetical protein
MKIRRIFENYNKYNFIQTSSFLSDIRDNVKIIDNRTLSWLQKNLLPFKSYDDGFRYKDCYQYLSWDIDVKFKIFSDNDELYSNIKKPIITIG